MIIRIGKASDNDFVVNDPHVSRYHAKLVREEGGYWLLEDLGSTNGTFVNGAQIVKKHVTPSDTIKLGDNYVLNISEALKSNNDYSEEFAVLKQIYDDYIQAKELFGLSLFITICAPTVGIYLGAKQSAKIPQLLQDLTNQFKIDYVCPKCGTFLGEIPWESLRNKKQCPMPSCKAKWVSE